MVEARLEFLKPFFSMGLGEEEAELLYLLAVFADEVYVVPVEMGQVNLVPFVSTKVNDSFQCYFFASHVEVQATIKADPGTPGALADIPDDEVEGWLAAD